MLKTRNKGRLIAAIVIPITFFIFFVISLIIGAVKIVSYTQINIFSDISECYALNNLKVDNTPLNDRYIKDIPYENSYTYKLNYDSNSFELYAYEFSSLSDAKKYYSEVWGHTNDKELDYNGHTNGMFSSKLIVRNGINVYRIRSGSASDFIEIKHYLNSIFTVQIEE